MLYSSAIFAAVTTLALTTSAFAAGGKGAKKETTTRRSGTVERLERAKVETLKGAAIGKGSVNGNSGASYIPLNAKDVNPLQNRENVAPQAETKEVAASSFDSTVTYDNDSKLTPSQTANLKATLVTDEVLKPLNIAVDTLIEQTKEVTDPGAAEDLLAFADQQVQTWTCADCVVGLTNDVVVAEKIAVADSTVSLDRALYQALKEGHPEAITACKPQMKRALASAF